MKEAEKLAFLTTQSQLPPIYITEEYSVSITLKAPSNPSPTKEWKCEGISYYVIGGVKTTTGSAIVLYPEIIGEKTINGEAHFRATPTKENQMSTAPAEPISTTASSLSLERRKKTNKN